MLLYLEVYLITFGTLSILLSAYECINRRCDRASGVENIDWGYYSTTNGNCQFCKYSCSNNVNCEAVECDASYCSWWKNGKCNEAKELTQESNEGVLTCLKNVKGKHISITS